MAVIRIVRGDLSRYGLHLIEDDEFPPPEESAGPMIEIAGDGCAKPYIFCATDLDEEDVIIL